MAFAVSLIYRLLGNLSTHCQRIVPASDDIAR
jgi:hypothetical protein